jgi:hypothetical protein
MSPQNLRLRSLRHPMHSAPCSSRCQQPQSAVSRRINLSRLVTPIFGLAAAPGGGSLMVADAGIVGRIGT